MQELKLIAWCDVCHHDFKRMEPAVSRHVVTLKMVGAKGVALARGLDLCAEHGEPVEALRRTMTRCGTTVPKEGEPVLRTENQVAKPAPKPKPSDEQEHRATKWGRGRSTCRLCGAETRRDNLVAHVQAKHGARVPSQPKKCPDCGERLSPDRAMRVHRSREHGYVYLDDVYATVK